MPMATLKLPTTPLVARAWLALVPGITAAMTGTSLPRIPTNSLPAWASTGFLTVQTAGGSPDPEMPIHQPVVSVKCWAVNAKQDPEKGTVSVSAKPPWERSEELAELVFAAYESMQRDPATKLVTMPKAGFAQACVESAYPLTEPRQIPDSMNRACHQFDLYLSWTRVPS